MRKPITQGQIPQFLDSGAVFGNVDGRFYLGWGKPQWKTQRPAGWALYVPDFYLKNPKSWLQFENSCDVSAQELLGLLQAFEPDEHSLSWSKTWIEPKFEPYADRFSHFQSQISRGELKKAVPIVEAELHQKVNAQNLANWLQRLLNFSGVRVYGFWINSENEGILGATPETLFCLNENKLESMALAGTISQKKSATGRELLSDKKELSEHGWVVESLREALLPFGEVTIGETEVVAAPGLWHLCTRISARLTESIRKEFQFERCVAQLHPTPALGFFPTQPPSTWGQLDLTRQGRDRFGAPFGLVDSLSTGELARAESLVAIRCLRWKSGVLRLATGAGIVQASELEGEWQELNSKRNSVKNMFAL